ncbi:MAG: tRNA 5-methoxyuridine(34)/uridine 5-oxyacetic acid(34) synthase CmoB [Gammaproteobacteria bacterium]|nr:MAG: tRNA 5-methoxyuridine(34)/uridine 5-oxyacetic acid(34) synthase CmoB [Gammaproteobacteria bacterium]
MKELIDFNYLRQFFSRHCLNVVESDCVAACHDKLNKPHGDVARWQAALQALPDIDHVKISIDQAIQLTGDLSDDCQAERQKIEQILRQLCPWRKGPLQFLHTAIDTEWDSLMKWRRVVATGIDFHGKNVVDIGCGNGVFLWAIADAGAKSVTGVDPMWLFYHQFMAFQRYAKNPHLCFLPLGVQDLPLKNAYDSVLSMGVLYHRKSPLDHLFQLKGLIKKGGDLILETIVLPDRGKTLLTPQDRYAGMHNVWMIPSVGVLQDWLIKTGFEIIHIGEPVKTTLDEQRQSDWMTFHSLNQFLHSDDDELTVEGHPAPYRIVVTAKS